MKKNLVRAMAMVLALLSLMGSALACCDCYYCWYGIGEMCYYAMPDPGYENYYYDPVADMYYNYNYSYNDYYYNDSCYDYYYDCSDSYIESYGTVIAVDGDTYIRSQPNLCGEERDILYQGQCAIYRGSSSTDCRGVRWDYVKFGDVYGWVSSRYTILI